VIGTRGQMLGRGVDLACGPLADSQPHQVPVTSHLGCTVSGRTNKSHTRVCEQSYILKECFLSAEEQAPSRTSQWDRGVHSQTDRPVPLASYTRGQPCSRCHLCPSCDQIPQTAKHRRAGQDEICLLAFVTTVFTTHCLIRPTLFACPLTILGLNPALL
jgi:hypothetical protein